MIGAAQLRHLHYACPSRPYRRFCIVYIRGEDCPPKFPAPDVERHCANISISSRFDNTNTRQNDRLFLARHLQAHTIYQDVCRYEVSILLIVKARLILLREISLR